MVFQVRAESTPVYSAQIVNEDEQGIPANSISYLRLTLFNPATGEIVNSRDAQNVLNTNGVTVDGSGNLEWSLDPEDLTVAAGVESAEHRARFDFAWDGGTKQDWHVVSFLVAARPSAS